MKQMRYCPKCNSLTDQEKKNGRWECLECEHIAEPSVEKKL